MESSANTGMQPSLGLILTYWKFPNSHDLFWFFARNSKSFQKHKVEVVVTTDPTTLSDVRSHICHMPDFNLYSIKVIAYPEDLAILSLGKANNFAISNCNTDIIMKTDPDIVFSDESLAYAKEICLGKSKALVQLCSNVPPATDVHKSTFDWEKLPKRQEGFGASFAMHRELWKKLKGYDERIDGWGGDDFELGRRVDSCGFAKLEVSKKFPVFHINHADRRRSPHFPFKSFENLKKLRTFTTPWHELKNEESRSVVPIAQQS